jgi:c-di-GMP-binding flagellar brake protein YcgR
MQCQRRYQRVPFLCPVELTALPEGKTSPARTLDVSLGGVGVLSQIGLEREHMVSVAFLLRNGQQGTVSESVLGRVAALRADDIGNVMGIEFIEPLTSAKHPALLRKLLSL